MIRVLYSVVPKYIDKARYLRFGKIHQSWHNVLPTLSATMLGTRRSEEIFEQPDRHDRYSVRSTTITIRVMLSIPREIRASR